MLQVKAKQWLKPTSQSATDTLVKDDSDDDFVTIIKSQVTRCSLCALSVPVPLSFIHLYLSVSTSHSVCYNFVLTEEGALCAIVLPLWHVRQQQGCEPASKVVGTQQTKDREQSRCGAPLPPPSYIVCQPLPPAWCTVITENTVSVHFPPPPA